MHLTDTQLVVLSAALNREDGSILPLPASLKGGALAKVCSALLAKGFAEEIALQHGAARTTLEKVFRTGDEKEPTMLRITRAGRQALDTDAEAEEEPSAQPVSDSGREGSEEVDAHAAPTGSAGQEGAPAALETPAPVVPRKNEVPMNCGPKQPRAGTKLERLIGFLRRPEGVTVKEASEALDWMEHSVRGALAGALKKKLGLVILSEKVDNRGRTYRIAD